MASRAKRRRAEGAPEELREQRKEEEENGGRRRDDDDGGKESDSDLESDEDEDEDEEEEVNEEINVEFEAHSISDNDKNGIKKLLQQQAEVLEESDDEDDTDEGTECAEQIKELVLSQCEKNCEPNMIEQLDKLLSDTTKPVGLLLSERFINVPPQIALPMHQQLQKELTEAQRTNKPCGKCYFYLLISKTFTDKKTNARKKGSNTHQKELMFSNAEEEFFYEKSLLKFSYSVEEESDSCLGGRWSFEDAPMKPLRTVMVIPADRMDAIMDKLKEYLAV
ncbi:hypothetical protein JD844_006678 [Phrynosoma platyrhinos]|uniref:Protein BCCIP homolog n=1 Tax=Phrynosoma platyrhinos TaxID=52577 RepID=A0ABQ7T1S5_PHRPL|nr:hypothetical protein JD844_006678 [Phrynosoma platyrhinos]